MHGERIGCRSGSCRLNHDASRHAFGARITSIATSGGAAMSAPASISMSGEAVAWGSVAPTAVCASKTAKRFMSHSRHRDGAGLPLAGGGASVGPNQQGHVWYDLRRCNGSVANRCWRSTATINRSRTVDSACIGCNSPAGRLLAGGRVMSDQRRKKNPELNTSRSGIGGHATTVGDYRQRDCSCLPHESRESR